MKDTSHMGKNKRFLSITACSVKQEILTVSEVIQNAEALDGKTIRVRHVDV